MKVDIDQSIKIEDTSRDTVVAFSNSISASAIIPRKIKRQLQQKFRKISKIHLFMYRIFAAGIVLLIKNYLRKIDSIIIDIEYPGHNELIKKMILEMLKKLRRKQPRIYFRQIGKKSNAHDKAYLTYKKKIKPDIVLKQKELENLVF